MRFIVIEDFSEAVRPARLAHGDKGVIRQIMGWTHVATPNRVVLRDLRDRLRKTGRPHKWPLRKAAYKYALAQHKQNQGTYQFVMGGMRRPRRRKKV